LEGAPRRGAAATLGTADTAAASSDSVADPDRQGRDALRKLLGK
jgi:hypothetical protein